MIVNCRQQNLSHTYAKESTLHVELHVVIVQAHDANKALESADLNGNAAALSRLADDLHDIIALALMSDDSKDLLTSRSKLSRINSSEL